MDKVKKASEIEDCLDCPLYQTDCPVCSELEKEDFQ